MTTRVEAAPTTQLRPSRAPAGDADVRVTPAVLSAPSVQTAPATAPAVPGTARDGARLLRNGHVLTLSSLLTATLGAGFWMVATSWYSTASVGRSYAAISAVSLLSGFGQLNLADVLVRFVPAAGRHTRRLVLRCYAASALFSTLLAGLFLLLVPVLAPGLDYLRSPLGAACFIAATCGYSIFVLQDGVLTGLRRAGWVLGENALFAAVKTGLLLAFGIWALSAGVLLSWAGALAVAMAMTNYYLFRHAVPRHQRAGVGAPAPHRLLRYAAADYLGALFRLSAYNVVPLIVLNRYGPVGNAYFSLAWVVGYSLFLAAYNMGSSMIVEAARCPERLEENARRILRHSGLLMAAAAVLIVCCAPWVLALFGPEYSAHGTTLLRLLSLAALPNLLLGIAIDVARARRTLGWAVGLQAVLCVLVLGLTAWLLPVFGIAGVGVAWLLAECLLAVPLLLTLNRWLPRRPPPPPGRSTP